MNKADFRKIVQTGRNTDDILTLQQNAFNTELILNRYLELECYKNAEIVFAYSSMEKEISTKRIIEAAIELDKKLALPKVISSIKDGARMEFVFINKDTEYKKGVYGILEPASDDYIDINKLDGRIEMLIPGLCFDLEKRRIGYGGGYYDRYLTKHPSDRFHITALAYEYQIFASLPANANDRQVDLIVTEKRCI